MALVEDLRPAPVASPPAPADGPTATGKDAATDKDAPTAAAPTAAALTEVVTRLRRALRTSIRTQFPWESLPVAQVELMQSLAEASPARMSALAERLHLAASTVSGLASQLIAAGLVERGTDPEDRRAAVVVLTPAGAKTLVEWEAAHERRISSALSQLEVEQRLAIHRAIPALSSLARLLAEPRLLEELDAQPAAAAPSHVPATPRHVTPSAASGTDSDDGTDSHDGTDSPDGTDAPEVEG